MDVGADFWWWVDLHLRAVGAEVVELAFIVPLDAPPRFVEHPVVEWTLGAQVPLDRRPPLERQMM